MKITDTKNVYKVELTKEEMEVLYAVTSDPSIDALISEGEVPKDSQMILIAQDMHIETSRVLYGTDEE